MTIEEILTITAFILLFGSIAYVAIDLSKKIKQKELKNG